jgi:hypothetical protein
MNLIVQHKQFVTDENGNHIGVILPMADYLLIEPLLRERKQKPKTREHRRQKLQRAAEIMRAEYTHDKELTAFTALDGEDFVE